VNKENPTNPIAQRALRKQNNGPPLSPNKNNMERPLTHTTNKPVPADPSQSSKLAGIFHENKMLLCICVMLLLIGYR